jgi:hypothetical protein
VLHNGLRFSGSSLGCNRPLLWLLSTLAWLASPMALSAQEPSSCTLQRCALYVDAGSVFHRLFGPVESSSVVQGDPEVDRYRLDASDRFASVFAERDSAAFHYTRFVTEDTRADALRSLSNLLLSHTPSHSYSATTVGVGPSPWASVASVSASLRRFLLHVLGTRLARGDHPQPLPRPMMNNRLRNTTYVVVRARRVPCSVHS